MALSGMCHFPQCSSLHHTTDLAVTQSPLSSVFAFGFLTLALVNFYPWTIISTADILPHAYMLGALNFDEEED